MDFLIGKEYRSKLLEVFLLETLTQSRILFLISLSSLARLVGLLLVHLLKVVRHPSQIFRGTGTILLARL